MAGKKQLPPVRLATEADAPAPPMSLMDAVEGGSRLDELLAMQRIVAAHIQNPKTLARDLAALTRRQMEMSKEIEHLRLRAEEERASDKSGRAADAKWDENAV